MFTAVSPESKIVPYPEQLLNKWMNPRALLLLRTGIIPSTTYVSLTSSDLLPPPPFPLPVTSYLKTLSGLRLHSSQLTVHFSGLLTGLWTSAFIPIPLLSFDLPLRNYQEYACFFHVSGSFAKNALAMHSCSKLLTIPQGSV